MPDENRVAEPSQGVEVEAKDKGVFDFMKKKEEEEEKPEAVAAEFKQKVQVTKAPQEEKKHHSFLEKLHRSDSSSSRNVKNKKNRSLLRIKRKGVLTRSRRSFPDTASDKQPLAAAPASAVETMVAANEHQPEKKGILEKTKEKFPGYHPKNGDNKKAKEKEFASSDD